MFTKKVVKYNKKKHNKSKWMTSSLLKSINTKKQLYKEWIKTDVNNVELILDSKRNLSHIITLLIFSCFKINYFHCHYHCHYTSL